MFTEITEEMVTVQTTITDTLNTGKIKEMDCLHNLISSLKMYQQDNRLISKIKNTH